jgi:hypothetical protein
MYCQFSIITTTNDTIHVDVSKLSDSFADGLLDDWA